MILNFFNIIFIIAFIDYLIYNYYKKKYIKNNYNQDIYKYRIIIYFIYWTILLYILNYNIINNHKKIFLQINIICFIIYLLTNLYILYLNNNFPIGLICVDLFFGLIITNILIILYLYIII